jgi:hypothetical protein
MPHAGLRCFHALQQLLGLHYRPVGIAAASSIVFLPARVYATTEPCLIILPQIANITFHLQVDCLSGMGAMYRDNGQLRAAEGFMRQALRCAEGLGDDVVRASCLTHLGSVLIASDAAAAIKHLEEAVQLREDQVGCGAKVMRCYVWSLNPVNTAGSCCCVCRFLASSRYQDIVQLLNWRERVVLCTISPCATSLCSRR